MKERFLLAVSWWCLVHAFLLVSVLYWEAIGARRSDLGLLGELMKGYFNLFPVPALAVGFPFIGWLVLWIVTGSPRILPWRKVEQDDEEQPE